jgi:hypothetical protein
MEGTTTYTTVSILLICKVSIYSSNKELTEDDVAVL